ncbi:hypothetical protein N431DRAFT_444675 [Stipitochalara longipes BDJ]|nr:hypothetical protein N431DRAFT_444675 [Stipitochalara longipes BDJ]
MAALVILSVAASAAQLVEYSLSIVSFITRICNKVRDAPRQYREYEIELKLLIYTARGIGQNPALQTADIQYHLDATLVDVEALQSILCRLAVNAPRRSLKRKYWDAINASDDLRISFHLESLHRKNTGLLLCICAVHTTQLTNVQGSLDQLVDMSAGYDHKLCAETGETEIAIQPLELDNTCERSQPLQLPQLLCENEDAALVVREKQSGLVTPNRLAEAPLPKRMGHKFGPAIFGDKATVTVGNSYSSSAPRPNEVAPRKGHTFERVDAGKESKIHLGDTGQGSLPWHELGNIKTGDSCVVHLGDFEDSEKKEKEFSSNWGGSSQVKERTVT